MEEIEDDVKCKKWKKWVLKTKTIVHCLSSRHYNFFLLLYGAKLHLTGMLTVLARVK
jgi:hypothetical protein